MAGNPPGKKTRGNRTGRKAAPTIPPERLNAVDQMLRQCLTHGAIKAILAKQWDLNPRQIQEYIARVYKMWEMEAKRALVDRVALRRSQLEGVLETAMQQKPPDLKASVSALDRLCRVDGAYAPIKEDVTHVVQVSGRVDTRSLTRKQRMALMDIARSVIEERKEREGKGRGEDE